MQVSTPKMKFSTGFVRKFWFSFIWRFIATAIVLGFIPGSVFMVLKSSGIYQPWFRWLEAAANLSMLFLASYYAVSETMNKFMPELTKAK